MLPKVQQVRPKVFFGTMRLFFENFRILSKGNPLHFLKFSACRKRWMSLNGLFLSFSALCDLKILFSKKIQKYFFWKKNNFFQIFPIVVPWIFLSLRYGADLGRSRLVWCIFRFKPFPLDFKSMFLKNSFCCPKIISTCVAANWHFKWKTYMTSSTASL